MKQKKSNQIKFMCLAGVFTAVVFVFTAYLHVPSYTGYTHVGDAFIYFAACLLPLPYAGFVGAGGALLADCLTGYAIWAPGSVVIKALTVLVFCRKGKKICSGRNLLALLPAAALCVGGYYLYGAILAGSFAAPVAEIPGNLMQALFSSILFVALGLAADKLHVKKYVETK